jgi:hypothetical protein
MPAEILFPWMCPTCCKREVYMSIISEYKAEIRHNEDLILFTVLNLKTPACQACGELLFTNKSDKQITDVFHQVVYEREFLKDNENLS